MIPISNYTEQLEQVQYKAALAVLGRGRVPIGRGFLKSLDGKHYMFEGGIEDCAIFLFFPSPKFHFIFTKKFLNNELLTTI